MKSTHEIVTAVEDLRELGEAATMPFTEAQLIDIVLGGLKITGDYQEAIENWYSLHAPARTWLGLKAHFNNARRLLRKAPGATM